MPNIPPPSQQHDKNAKHTERDLLKFCQALMNEGAKARNKWVSKDGADSRDVRAYRGLIAPSGFKGKTDDRVFRLNIIQTFIDTMVARLTDNRPMMRVDSIKAGLHDMAVVLEDIIPVIWDESRAQRQLFKMCHNSSIRGISGFHVGYDAMRDRVLIEVLRPHQIIVDPDVCEAGLIEEAEYVGVKRQSTLSALGIRYPGRGGLVREDVEMDGSASAETIDTPVEHIMASRNKPSSSGSVIPRATVNTVYLIDRENMEKGKLMFPRGRRVVFTKDVLLDDGVNPYWDGTHPVDIFDWTVDPNHIWGLSEPSSMINPQNAFNEIMDGVIQNQIQTNQINITGDHDALLASEWSRLKKMKNTNVMPHRKNSSFAITPPPVFGSDKIAVARQIFSFLQILKGVTDVVLGENPGSLQSGRAVEGLVEGANIMTRARASRLEDFMTRVGQKIIARIIQFIPTDRILSFLGPKAETLKYGELRQEFFFNDKGIPMSIEERAEVFRYLRFAVLPGSSAPGTRQARAQQMMALHSLPRPLVSGKDVLEAADFRNADEMIKRAKEEQPLGPPAPAGETPQVFT